MTVRLDPGQLVALVITAAALLAAIGYLARKGRRAMRLLRAIARLLEHELDYNHGGSLKDDVHGIAVTVGRLSRHVDQLDNRLTAHLRNRKTT